MSITSHPMDPSIATFGCDLEDLTVRERQMIEAIANGLTNAEIASTLFLSINSVKTYIRSAYRKIGATSRTHAVIWGARHGLCKGIVSQ